MPANWKRIAEQTGRSVEEFQRAALHLVVEQIIYQANSKQRNNYNLIAAHEDQFAEVLDLLGCKLDHNAQQRYVATVPQHLDVSKIPLMHTLLALVLRKLYDHHMNQGTLNAGVAGVSLTELETAFKESTGRELPMKPQTELINILEAMRRWGIARGVKDDNLEETTWYVEILPGIQSLITERSLAMLKAHAEMLYEPESETAEDAL